MNFYTVRDLRTTPKSLWEDLVTNGEVVITNNGRPTAIMLDISDGSFEETLKAVRQAKAAIAFNSMRAKAAAKGYMSDEEIEAEIAAARRGVVHACCNRHKYIGIGTVVKKQQSGQDCKHDFERCSCSLF